MATAAHAEPPEYEWEQITLNASFAPRDGAGAVSKLKAWPGK
ncbi:MAG TPA: hypothetical protein VMV10_14280 [Pirellulales bacterium]|nr:hypothetical protein [Pirellulales bacterium]